MARKAARSDQESLLRQLPSIDELLRDHRLDAAAIARAGRSAATAAARAALSALRSEIRAGKLSAATVRKKIDHLPQALQQQLLADLHCSLRPVINATGVILHTNLGRAPLASAALEQVAAAAAGYSNLEFDLATGERGERDAHVSRLFARLLNVPGLPYESATIVVNNNAAAVLLALNALADGGEVLVSRGELVEIGGSFRIPEIMSKSGAVLCEVGTTNRTRLADYERAIHERTRLILRVHRSNFQIVGFTEQPSLEELVELGRRRQLPVMEDLGSGALFDLRAGGIGDEPAVSHSLRAGVDVVTYSGDKLLGGPQAGLLSGEKDLIARIRRNPLFRALRVDKLTYAALEATLLAYVRGDVEAIPALRFMRLPVGEIAARAQSVMTGINRRSAGIHCELLEGESILGGGSGPGVKLPTKLIAISGGGMSSGRRLRRLRQNNPPIIARVESDRVLIDLRTVFPEQDVEIANAVSCVSEQNQ